MSASHRRTARAAAVRLAADGRRAGRAAARARRGAPAGAGGRPVSPRAPGGGRRPRMTRRSQTAGPPPPGGPPAVPVGGRGPRRPGLTTRAAVLALVVCGILLGLAYPLRTHLAQRAQIDRLVEESQERAGRVAALEADLARYSDPGFIESEARRRLGFVHPGETLYTVLDPSAPVEEPEPEPPTGVPPLREQAPWWGQLWHSAQGSDAAPVEPAAPTR